MYWLELLNFVLSTLSLFPQLEFPSNSTSNSSITNFTGKTTLRVRSGAILSPASTSNPPTLESFCPNLNPRLASIIRFDQDAQKCGQIGSQEHCSENMEFYSYSEDSVFGHCDCLDDVYYAKPFVYDPGQGRCFRLFEQGPCETWQWLTVTSNGPTCTRNPCLNLLNSNSMVIYKHMCVELNKPNVQCEPQQVVSFVPGQLQPQCVKTQLLIRKGIGSFGSKKCSAGTFLSLSGKCQVGWNWK